MKRLPAFALAAAFAAPLGAAPVSPADLPKLKPGLWEVKVTWTADGADYFIGRKIVISAAKT